jgi:putative tricarboxylic transport membrane protein
MKIIRLTAAPIAGFLGSIVLLIYGQGLNKIADPGQYGPGFWPHMILWGMMFACAAKLVIEVRRARATNGGAKAELPPISRTLLGTSIGLILLYTVLAPIIGFTLSTLLFIAAFMWVSGSRSNWMIGINSVGGTLLLLYLFVKLVYLPLPKGYGMFETLTVALYHALHLY